MLNRSEPRTIMCPKCGKKIGTLYDRFKSDMTTFSCWGCKKLVIYHRKDKTLEIKNMETRSTSSGMRFC